MLSLYLKNSTLLYYCLSKDTHKYIYINIIYIVYKEDWQQNQLVFKKKTATYQLMLNQCISIECIQ